MIGRNIDHVAVIGGFELAGIYQQRWPARVRDGLEDRGGAWTGSVQKRWFDDVFHALMSSGTLRRCLLPQTYGRNWALDDLPNLRCVIPVQVGKIQKQLRRRRPFLEVPDLAYDTPELVEIG